jgi:hypothetical protein
MPRQRRLSPGGQRGSGAGAAISGIGELLHSIFGGVAPNQDFGMQGPTPSGEALGGGNPYVAKSFLDRRDASNANADYFAEQASADADSSRRLKALVDALPIEMQHLINQKQVELDFTPKFDEHEIKKAQALGNSKLLTDTLNIPDLPGNLDSVQSRYTEPRLRRKIADEEAGTTVANTLNTKSGIEGKLAKMTEPVNTELALAAPELQLQQILSGQRMIQPRENAEIDQYRRENELGNLELDINGVVPLNNGLYDVKQRGYIEAPPSNPADAMLRQQTGMPEPSYPMANPRMSEADEVIINGVKINANKMPQAYAAATERPMRRLNTNIAPKSTLPTMDAQAETLMQPQAKPTRRLIPGGDALVGGLKQAGGEVGSQAFDLLSGRASGKYYGSLIADLLESIMSEYKRRYTSGPQNANR